MSADPSSVPADPAAFAAPHEIPADVIVRAFVKAEADALHLVVRVPLTSMRDVDFPVRGPGYVEIGEATELLADQAKVWIADYVTLFEEAVPPPRTRRHRRPHLPPLRPLLRRLRPRRRAHRRPAPRPRHRADAGTGHARRRPPHSNHITRVTLLDRPRLGPPGDPHDYGAALHHPRRRGEGLPVPGQSRPRPPRSALAPGAAALRRARLRPHLGRDRPSALPALPGDPAEAPSGRSCRS